MCFCRALFRDYWPHDFGDRSGPHGRSCHRNQLYPPPQDIKQLQRFLSMVNFYCCFLPNCTQVLRPLTDLLKGRVQEDEWTASVQGAFQNAKHLLATAVPLQHPTPHAELSLATNASDTHIGGVMQQKSGDHGQPLGFFSKKLTDTKSP
jgi:hypothetical protein